MRLHMSDISRLDEQRRNELQIIHVQCDISPTPHADPRTVLNLLKMMAAQDLARDYTQNMRRH